jgi:6,7-dimethyl-8-ribityllumazine synthase
MKVMLKTGVPIGMGIITTNNLKQAKDRSGTKNNKGSEAAQAVLEMIG